MCASGLPTQTAVADADYVVWDDFDSFDGTKWNASAYFAPDFGYSCGQWPETETWLYIEKTTGGLGDGAGRVGWKFYHTLAVPCSRMFSASIEIRWVETSDSQMGHVRLSLDDATGDYQINVGFEDSWAYNDQRGMQAVIGGVRTFAGGLPLVGRATLTVTRDANGLVTAASDGVIFAQGVCAAEISTVGLWLYGCKYYPGVSCGVNYLSAHFETGAGYDVADDFDAFNATTWSATPYFAPDFGYSCGSWVDGQTWLYVENTTGGVGDEQGYVGWLFNHMLPSVRTGPFRVSMGLSWIMNSDWQVGHVRLMVQDQNGVNQVDAGFMDSWSYSSQRCKEATIGDTYVTESGLPLRGAGALAVTRDADNLVRVSWDGVVFAQGVCAVGIGRIAIWLIGNKNYAGVSCGVDYFSAHLETGAGYDVADDFDAFNATTWSATPYFAPDFGYSCDLWGHGETWLYFENTSGGVGDEQGCVGWLFEHTLPFLCTGEFQVSMPFRWVMTSYSQVCYIRVMLQDENGAYQIDAGLMDWWSYSGERCKLATIGSTYVLEYGLPLIGTGALGVTRDANHLVQVSWDGAVFAHEVCPVGISRIAICLIVNKNCPGVACGVNSLYAHFTGERTTTRVLPIGHVIELLALIVADTTLVSAISVGLYLSQRSSGTLTTGAPTARGGISAGSSEPFPGTSGPISPRCLLCGAPLSPGDRFCYHCGAELQS